MIDHFRRELGALKKYSSVRALEIELNEFAESRREEQHMHNEDEWKRLVNDPIKLAKTAYLRHISDHCAALSINQWVFDYSCAKIDSWTGFFNSRMGKARDLIYEKIDTAIKNEKVADHDHIQKSKAKYGRISDISRCDHSTIPYLTIQCHTIPDHTMLCDIISYLMLSYLAILHSIMSYCTLLLLHK